jgi:transcriptional activator HAC1
MELQQASTMAQFDNSPADSFISTPGETFSSLFPSGSGSATMDPTNMLTPQSSDDRQQTPCDTEIQNEEAESTPTSEKKTKKRKSWGQVLPEPKTNLPPRKRAKTEDEKEQRRVERVLRNRRAAQSSRERKRLEVEALEKRNQELEAMLRDAQKTNLLMFQQIQALRQESGLATAANPLLDSVRDNTLALSQELFSSQDGYKPENGLADDLLLTTTNATVNPASLSPELAPVPDVLQETEFKETQSAKEPSLTSPDVTQHPAEMLYDLPCHMSAEVMPSALPDSQTLIHPLLTWLLQFRMISLSASAILSACQRPLMQIAMSSKAGFSLRPTPQLLTTIIWLVTLPKASSSTSTTSSPQTKQAMPLQNLWQRATTAPLRTTGSTTRSTTLRLKSLRKILSSSPNLARPLSDATMAALRLVSEGRDDRVETSRGESSATRDNVDRELTECLSSTALPSREVLLTLLWSIKVEERRQQRKKMQQDVVLVPGKNALQDKVQTNQKFILKMKKERRSSSSRRQRVVGGAASQPAI